LHPKQRSWVQRPSGQPEITHPYYLGLTRVEDLAIALSITIVMSPKGSYHTSANFLHPPIHTYPIMAAAAAFSDDLGTNTSKWWLLRKPRTIRLD
jgi:hypothetical protein